MSDLTTQRRARQPGAVQDPERVAAWRRLQEVQERLRIGYQGQAPDDLAWAIEQLLKLWEVDRHRERLQELLDQEQRRVTDLRSRNGKLLVQNDRLREEIDRLRTEAENLVAAAPADTRRKSEAAGSGVER
jgi:hypothetical protein